MKKWTEPARRGAAVCVALAITLAVAGLTSCDMSLEDESSRVAPRYILLVSDFPDCLVGDRLDCIKGGTGGAVNTDYVAANSKAVWRNPLLGSDLSDGVTFLVDIASAGDVYDCVLTVCKAGAATPAAYNALGFFEGGNVRYIPAGKTGFEDTTDGFSIGAKGTGSSKVALTLRPDGTVAYSVNGGAAVSTVGAGYTWAGMKTFLTSTADTIGVDLGFSDWKSGYIDAGTTIGDVKIYDQSLTDAGVAALSAQ